MCHICSGLSFFYMSSCYKGVFHSIEMDYWEAIFVFDPEQ